MKRVNKDIKKLAFENAIGKSPIITRQVVKSFYDYFNELIKQNGGEYDIPFEKNGANPGVYYYHQQGIRFKNGKEIVLYSSLGQGNSNGIFIYAPI